METPLENKKIEIEQETIKHLNTTRKWAMFLAIIGIYYPWSDYYNRPYCGTFLTAFNSGGKDLGIPESLMFVPILLLAVIYFSLSCSCSVFQTHTSHAVQTLDKLEFHKAIKNLNPFLSYRGPDNYFSFTLYCCTNCCRIFTGFFKRALIFL